jgi:hypothetical protein
MRERIRAEYQEINRQLGHEAPDLSGKISPKSTRTG